MKAIINGAEHPISKLRGGASPGILGAGLPEPEGVITIISDDGQTLLHIDTAKYLRSIVSAEGITLTNEPEPEPPTAEELLAKAKADALARIDGKCSAAIYSGIDYEGKHYSLTDQKQGNMTIAMTLINSGDESVSYAADGEGAVMWAAADFIKLYKAAHDWGLVNTYYYAALKTWIGAETDTAVLAAIDYGSALPVDYMTALGYQLAALGIDAAGYMGMMSGNI